MVTVFTYHVEAFAPDPSGVDKYFTYDSTVDRDALLNNGQQYEALAKGLSDHIYAAKGVRVSPASIVIKAVELLGSRQEKTFPSAGLTA